jgi:hypothetical protein
MRPLSPVDLSAEFNAAGDLTLAWTRRSRSGFAWLDDVDAPIGETREQYAITISAGDTTLELTSEQPALVVSALDLEPLGTAEASVEVRQVGDSAASRPAQLTINLS